MPQAQLHYPASYAEQRAWFLDDPTCLDHLDWLRWPGTRQPGAHAAWAPLAERPLAGLKLTPPALGDVTWIPPFS